VSNSVVSLAGAEFQNIPTPTDEQPFLQVEWIFKQRLSRVPSESGKDNYRYALRFYSKFLRETHGESSYVLKERWDGLAMVRFKAWLLTQEQTDSSQFGGHTVVGIMSAVRQVMSEAVSLGYTASHEIFNAPMPPANKATNAHDAYSNEELASILEAVRKDMICTSAVLRGYTRTGGGRDPQTRPHGLGINPRDYAEHGYGWNSEENLRWYFENRMNCRAVSRVVPEAIGHKPFFSGANRYHGGYMAVYKSWGVTPQIDRDILWPLFIQLSYLTGLNPYSIAELRVDCLAEHPLTGTPYLRYFKLRSCGEKELLLDLLNKEQHTSPEFESDEIPLKREHALLVERVVAKILCLTKPLRERPNCHPDLKHLLFIYESSGNNCNGEIQAVPPWKANQWCRAIGRRHDLRASSGKRLVFTLVRFRPTRLTEMAAQGKDFFEIQHAAGHKSIIQTLAYIEKRTLDTVAEKAVTAALETIWSNRKEFCPDNDENPKPVVLVPFRGLLSNCKNVFDPPRAVQLAADYVPGQACTRFNMCLLCKNIVLMKEHLPVLAHYRNQIRRSMGNSGVDLPHAPLYAKSLSILDQVFDPNTSDFSDDELDEAVANSELLDIVIDPLVYSGGEA
jgi:hypothetical protein